MNITLEQTRRIAERFGHADLVVEPRGTGFRARCSCGYISVIRRNERLAAEAAIHHMDVIVRRFVTNGGAVV